MKRGLVLTFLLLILLSVSCVQEIEYGKLPKSNYEDIIENKDVSVRVKETELTNDTEKIALAYTNNSNVEYLYDKEPHLEINHNDVWYVLSVNHKVGWNDMGQLVSRKDTVDYTLSLKDYYGELENGSYRFIKGFYANETEVLTEVKFKVENNTIIIEENKELSVEIGTDKDYFSRMDHLHPTMTFTPILKGETDKDIQYHWIMENDVDFEGFTTLENGPTKDIINSGEPVGLGIYAQVSYVEGAVMEFKIILQVEEKGTSNILAKDEFIIENREGEYRIKK